MDDGANIDLIDVSPIGSPYHSQIIVKQQWRGEPHSDNETEDAIDISGDFQHHRGPSQSLPHPQRGFRSLLEPLILDSNLSPPFLCSPSYPSTIEGTPSPLSRTSDYFNLDDNNLRPPSKFDDDIQSRHYPNLLIYDPDEPDAEHAWDPHSNFSGSWDVGDDSDSSEASDEYRGYITFAGESAPRPPEIELGSRQFDLSELSVPALDFPEDVGELLEHDAVSADGGSDGNVIGRLGQPTLVPVSEILVELSVQLVPDDSRNSPVHAPNIRLPPIQETSEDSDGSGSFLHLRYLGSNVIGVPTNVPLSPLVLVADGFHDDISPPYLDLLGLR